MPHEIHHTDLSVAAGPSVGGSCSVPSKSASRPEVFSATSSLVVPPSESELHAVTETASTRGTRTGRASLRRAVRFFMSTPAVWF
jgi:hypothetical protein